MASIFSIATVNITLAAAVLTAAGFGKPLALVSHSGGDLVKEYASIDDVADDHSSSTDAWKMANAMFAQPVAPSSILIGKRATSVAGIKVITYSADFVTLNSIAVTVNGTVITQVFDTNHTTTITALAAQIQALGSIATAVANAGARTVTITGDLTDRTYGGAVNLSDLGVTLGASQATSTVTITTAVVNIQTILDSIQEVNKTWFGWVCDQRLSYISILAAAWTEAQIKLFVTQSNDAGVLDAADTTDVAYLLKAAGYNKTVGIYHPTDTVWADAAYLANRISTDLDSKTPNWRYVNLSGITTDTTSDSGDEVVIASKNFNYYTDLGGSGRMQPGVTCSGRKIAIQVGISWLHTRMVEALVGAILEATDDQSAIPYTDKGMQALGAIAKAELEAGIDTGLLRGPLADNAVTIGSVDDVDAADKTAGILRLTARAQLAGSIDTVVFSITLET